MKSAKYLLIPICFLFFFTSCKKELFKQNTNPTQVNANDYNANFLLTTTQLMYTGSGDFGSDNWYAEWGEIGGFIQHTASTSGFYTGDKYLNNPGAFGVYFGSAYIYQVHNVVELYELTLNKPEYRNLHQMSRIMKALVFERITDLYGDIPYSQAGLGYYEHIYYPVYDKQQDIYADLLKEVSEATDSLDENADKPTGDVFYANDASTQIEKWRSFGYTLQLRMAMRLTKVDPATAQEYVKKVEGKTMQSNDDNAIVQHQDGNDVTKNRDSWSIYGQDSADLKLNATYINFLKENHDPRLPIISWVYFNKNPNSDPDYQLGMPGGYILGGQDPTHDLTKTSTWDPTLGLLRYSRFNVIVLNNNAPNLILTYAESEFLLADAAERWGVGSDAATHYNNGVIAAITQLSAYGSDAVISESDAQKYLNANLLSMNKDSALNQINTQFWASTIFNEYEAWCNWRRTSSSSNPLGYPKLIPTKYPGNISNSTIPRRFTYPQDQKVSNTTNYNAAVEGLPGGDDITSRMWWDVK